MSKPEVFRRNADGDRTTVIHSYAPGDGNLSFVAADIEHPHSAVSPGPTREECKAAGIEPLKCEDYYNATVSGGAGDPRLPKQE